ncbi:MAG: hypothetical protein IKM74_05980 [Bacteroidales bacterium]|nr:hypothetical protein [Bacteroidales bacterium]
MKKALVLGVLAFFAINIASVQNANAQNKKGAVTTTETTAVQEPKSTNKTVKQSKSTAAAAAKASAATKTEAGKEKVVKPATAPTNQKEAKACCKEEGKDNCKKEAAPKIGSKNNDPTQKNKTPEIGVPPTPNKTKKSTSSSTATTTTGTTK